MGPFKVVGTCRAASLRFCLTEFRLSLCAIPGEYFGVIPGIWDFPMGG